jgi:hypothetical protein
MPVWIGTVILSSGRPMTVKEEINGVSASEAKTMIENKYGGTMTGLPGMVGKPDKSFGSVGRPSSFSSSGNDPIDNALELAGGALALGAKGLWKLGKFGVRKYQENKEDKLRKERNAIELSIGKFLDNPRIFNVAWKFASNQTSFNLDGRQTLTFLQTPLILSRYIDEALDDLDDSPEVLSIWKSMLETCEQIKRDLIDRFPDNLTFNASENSCELTGYLGSPGNIYATNKLLLRLLSRDGDTFSSDSLKLQKRLSKSLKAFEGICVDSIWDTVELPLTPLTEEYFEEPSRDQNEDYNSTIDAENWEDDSTDEVSFTTDNQSDDLDYEDNTPNSDTFDGGHDEVNCETSTYGCIWYEREGFSLNPNPEGTLVISDKKIFFVETDMDIAGVLAIINNEIDDDGAVRWIFSPDSVSSVTKSKVSFRSAYTINTRSGGSYKMVFMPGQGESVIARLRQLGIQTSF